MRMKFMRKNKYKSLATGEFSALIRRRPKQVHDLFSVTAVGSSRSRYIEWKREWKKNYNVNTNIHFRRRGAASKPITINLYVLRGASLARYDAFGIINTIHENEKRRNERKSKRKTKNDARHETRTSQGPTHDVSSRYIITVYGIRVNPNIRLSVLAHIGRLVAGIPLRCCSERRKSFAFAAVTLNIKQKYTVGKPTSDSGLAFNSWQFVRQWLWETKHVIN